MDRSPALRLRFPAHTTAAARDRLVALLAEYALTAIHEDDPVAPASWIAFFADEANRDAARAGLASIPEADGIGVESLVVEDEDWARRTQADLPAVTVGRIVVAPPWDVPPALSGTSPILVVIEPSRGFGTGHHQSTRLCLRLLQDLEVQGATVVDVGTGSGVLAITAAKLGASRVVALDEDPDAVENARENADRNAVADRVDARVEDALSGSGAPLQSDVVLANLTGSLLSRHAAAVGAFAGPAGRLIVSGFTIDERDAVVDAFLPAFSVADSADEDDWWAFVLVRGR